VAFALVFAASELVGASARRSGEAMMRMLRLPYADIGYFGLAYDIASMGSMAVAQLTISFVPLCVMLRAAGRELQLARLMHGVVKALTALGVAVLYATLLLGPRLVPRMLGVGFSAVSALLVPLVLTLVTSALGGMLRLAAIVWDRASVALASDLVSLGTFWLLGVPLGHWRGSLGMAIAVLASAVAGVIYAFVRLHAHAGNLLLPFTLTLGLGLLWLPLCFIHAPDAWAIVLMSMVCLLYAGALALTRVVTRRELAAAWVLLHTSRGQPPAPQGG
jgi:O-antigen/teichoic acid export membrane protein